MSDSLLTTSFLFRFSAPLAKYPGKWAPTGLKLDESYRLPSFAELDQAPRFADVRVGWSEAGLWLGIDVAGKKQAPWCRENRIEDSDGLHVWIDTRDTHNIHRAGKFCHHFVFLPSGGGNRLERPVAEQLLINRARENAKPVRPGALLAWADRRAGGYVLDAHIPAMALTGFDPAEHPKLGFTYAVVDRELGTQTLACAPTFPYQEDPSLWSTLEMGQ